LKSRTKNRQILERTAEIYETDYFENPGKVRKKIRELSAAQSALRPHGEKNISIRDFRGSFKDLFIFLILPSLESKRTWGQFFLNLFSF
jgi:hypothetical protein